MVTFLKEWHRLVQNEIGNSIKIFELKKQTIVNTIRQESYSFIQASLIFEENSQKERYLVGLMSTWLLLPMSLFSKLKNWPLETSLSRGRFLLFKKKIFVIIGNVIKNIRKFVFLMLIKTLLVGLSTLNKVHGWSSCCIYCKPWHNEWWWNISLSY